MDTALLLSSFVAGFLTVIAPCILPLLPVVIGGSLGGEKRNPFVVIGSLLVSIIIFTILIEGISQITYIPDTVWRYISATLILIVGLSFLFSSYWAKLPFVSKLSISSNKALGKGAQKHGFIGDVIIGASLGPIFTSCSPTYLALVATIISKDFLQVLIYLVAFVAGLGLVLLFIALLGETVIQKLNAIERVKKIIGVIIVVIALFVYFGIDKDIGTFFVENGLFVDIGV